MRIILVLLLLAAPAWAGESKEAERLAKLAEQMKEFQEKLRSDRHDLSTQVEGQLIESSLNVMIEKQEKEQQKQQQKEQKAQKQQKQQQQQQGSKPSQSPMANSMPRAPVPHGETNSAPVVGKQSDWAKLPKAQREELLQVYRSEIPERWRKRLAAYFLSIAAEEGDKNDKK